MGPGGPPPPSGGWQYGVICIAQVGGPTGMTFITRGMIFIGCGLGGRMAPGVKLRACLVPSDFAHSPDFCLFFQVRISPIPLPWGPPGCLPRHFSKIHRWRKAHSRSPSSRILCFLEKSGGQVHILSPVPNVDRNPAWPAGHVSFSDDIFGFCNFTDERVPF